MPHKEIVGEDAEKPRVVETEDEERQKQTVAAVRTAPPWPLITIGVFATVVILAVFIGGWAFIASQAQDATTDRTPSQGRFGMMNGSDSDQDGTNSNGGGGQGFGYGGGFRRGGSSFGSIAARGVITAINGGTLTVSGQGKQVTVTKSTSTTIGGDKTDVAVNDTVIVFGTTGGDGTVSATRIIVNNQNRGLGANLNSDVTPGT